MLDVICQIFETTLFGSIDEANFICISQISPEANVNALSNGEFQLPKGIFPESCQIQQLSSDEAFLGEIQAFLLKESPKNILLIPPFTGARDLSKALRQQFPRWNLYSIILKSTIDSLPSGARLGAILPEGFCSDFATSDIRKHLFQNANLEFVISLDNSHHIFPVIHHAFKFCILILEVGQSNKIPIKFFKISAQSNAQASSEVIKDFQKLIKQGGGETKYGYIYRESIEPGEKLTYEKYHPDLLQRQKEIGEYGSVQKLKDICEIRLRHIHTTNDASKLLPGDSPQGIPLISSREILADGSLNLENTRYEVVDSSTVLLEPGDICLRKILGSADSRLKFSEITLEMPPLAASDNVVVLRLKPEVSPENRELVLAYLGSEFAIEWLSAQGMSIHLYPSLLGELPVPLFDDDLRNAFQSLNEAARQFDEWQKAAKDARSSLFKSSSAKDSRLFLLTVGRTARQRQEAAKLIDDFDYRARTRLPHPIAYRWRTVKSSYADLEGYIGVLECAEVSISYLAHIAIILAQHKSIPIQHLNTEMSERLTNKQHGTNFGDWVSILRQIRASKEFRALTGHIPFYEVLKFLETEADSALQRLSKSRNDLAHNRGPKGSDIPKAYKTALEDLEVLLKSAEFVSEYPLRYIEETKRDSIKKVTSYSYRDLMGDHPLVPIQTGQTSEPELEAGSLYLVDRDEKLYLLRPLLSRRQCPVCGVWATFYLDSYRKNGDITILKSMEHGHTAEDAEVTSIFKDWSILSS